MQLVSSVVGWLNITLYIVQNSGDASLHNVENQFCIIFKIFQNQHLPFTRTVHTTKTAVFRKVSNGSV